MRLSSDALSVQLKKTFYPVYVLYGNEPFLIDLSAQLIRDVFQKEDPCHHFSSYTLSSNAASVWEDIQLATCHPSLFNTKQLIEIRLQDSKFSQKDAKWLETLLSKRTDETYFVFRFASLSKHQQLAKWFTQADKIGVSVAHWSMTGATFSRWLSHRLKEKQVSLPPEDFQRLLLQTEGNCLAASQEIEVLALAQLEQPSFSDTTLQNQFSISDLTEAILQQNAQRIIHILSGLKSNGVAFQLIFWSLTQMHRVLTQGQSVKTEHERAALLQQAGIRSTWQAFYLKRINEYSDPKTLLTHLFSIDKSMKTGSHSHLWHELAIVSFTLAGLMNWPKCF